MKWRAICDRCSAKRWNTDLRKQWNGLMVCRDTCWESRNAQDSVRGVPDRQNPPWVRPEPAEVFENKVVLLRESGGFFLREVQSLTALEPAVIARETQN